MSEKFKALVINQEGDNFTREVKSLEKNFLKHGDVLIKVEYYLIKIAFFLIIKNFRI